MTAFEAVKAIDNYINLWTIKSRTDPDENNRANYRQNANVAKFLKSVILEKMRKE